MYIASLFSEVQMDSVSSIQLKTFIIDYMIYIL